MPFDNEIMPGNYEITSIPSLYIKKLLTGVDDGFVLKIALYFFWFVNQQEESSKYVTLNDILNEEKYSKMAELAEIE